MVNVPLPYTMPTSVSYDTSNVAVDSIAVITYYTHGTRDCSETFYLSVVLCLVGVV